ncbi:hypothetical protein R2R35_04630 [Anaerocolumna sp. AGMB13020]|uniref:glycoside hydrolase family 28 protein n=1 Tax=Anaerocolumna sp. AGMB13020 TaxID=3081750 RepID=UPI002953020A|nr:hypothetical protein [Anaerocolumna sp. AGMB13020]WOO37788.1 hypothetical protein R2R35_04630 [Anaerocolumna sp. AGMB13020]
MFAIKEATGCPFGRNYLEKEEHKFDICTYGAGIDMPPVTNTIAINAAIREASIEGGTVIIPKGDFRVYTIVLMSGVNIYLSEGSVLHAAKTDIENSYELQEGEGGNYDEPEVNAYVGLQDHGHTYFRNSLIYGSDISEVMIYGPGLLDGSFLNDKGELEHVLMGGDPPEPGKRMEAGHRGEWFGNKAIALCRCRNVVLRDFSLLAGGHFAIIATCVTNLLVEQVLVDTNRDALDVDCCQNVTIRNSAFNSLTDDAIVLKASYGGGIFKRLENVLVEDCKVSGYDMGSVYDRTFTTDKLIATDRCGPTARVKLGTEATCGYDCVTVRRVQFKRSRGFALEAVDGSDLSNILFEDSTMEDVSSSPIFIRAGDRGRYPVTGNSSEEELITSEASRPNVRLQNTNWILPAKENYSLYPARRYLPAYNRTHRVTADGCSFFEIVDQVDPLLLNPANYHEEEGRYFAYKYDLDSLQYLPDYDCELMKGDLPLYANAFGSERIASVHDIIIRDISVRNADPRYPIELMGLVGSRLRNIILENITVEYRGGFSLKEAVEQRQVNTNWEYRYNKGKRSIQSLPWLINTFFLKNEGLLPRAEWNPAEKAWKAAPFNIPELPEVYPEPSNWGILPAYGLYARHVENLKVSNLTLHYLVEDSRYPIVLDDVVGGTLCRIHADHREDREEVVCVTNKYKRPAGLEYVPDYPYQLTSVEKVEMDSSLSVKQVQITAPAPGTPKDGLYSYETAAITETGYNYDYETANYPLPQTVYRPFFRPIPEQRIQLGQELVLEIIARQPAYEVSLLETDGKIYNESLTVKDYSVKGVSKPMTLKGSNLPEGAVFDSSTFVPGKPSVFKWKPTEAALRKEPYKLTFTADDGIIPVKMEVFIRIIK